MPIFILVSAHPETASFDPGLRSRFSAILGIVPLCLWLQKTLGPCPEPKSTISGWALVNGDPIRPALRVCKNLLMILLLITVTCAGVRAEFSAGTLLSNALPTPEWKLQGQPHRYIPPNLYEYINGAAEFFIGFGFIELTGAHYAPASGS